MATAEVSRAANQIAQEAGELRQRGARAFRYGSLATLLLLMGIVYFAPAIVAHTPLCNYLLRSAVSVDGDISLGSASLGWFSTIEARDLEVHDAAGNQVLQVGSLRTSKSLAGILFDSSDVGRVTLEQLKLRLVCEDADTNLEKIFAPSLEKESNPSRFAAQLELIDGTVLIDDAVANRQFRIEKLSLRCQLASDSEVIVSVAGALPQERQAGSFKVDLHSQSSPDDPSLVANGKVDCQANAVPLELLAPVLRRMAEKAELSGKLTARLGGGWGHMASGGDSSLAGEAIVTDLKLAAAALGDDRIELARIEVPCQIVQQGEVLRVEQLAIDCELGNLSLKGTLNKNSFSAEDPAAALARENFEVKGNLDLAKLAQLLPQTLRIREGTEITAGQIVLALTSRQQDGGMNWSGHVDASGLAGEADGRPLTWDHPLSIRFATHETKDGIVLDRAECNSSFLQVNAAGSINDLTASANFDVAKLLSELRRFADLDELELAGQGQAQLTWKRLPGELFNTQAKVQARNFQYLRAGKPAWREDQIVATLDAGGQLAGSTIKRVDRGNMSIEAGSERLQAQLYKSVSEPATAAWPLQCSWRGQLASWAPRLDALWGLSGWDLRGAVNLQTALLCSSQAIEFEHAKLEIAQLHAWGHEWFISEPQVALTTEGRYDREKARVTLTNARLTAGTTVAQLNQASLQSTTDGWSVDGGTAQLGAELANLYRWRQDPRVAATLQVSGRLTAEAELKLDPRATIARVDAAIDQLQLVDRTPPAPGTPASAPSTWRERRITLAMLGKYAQQTEQMQFEKLQVASDALRCDATGVLPLSSSGGDVDLKGTLQYDWEALAPLWRASLGQSVQIAGKQARNFAVRGRLTGSPTSSASWNNVTGEAAVGWTGMEFYGLQVGRGEIVASLADGHVRTQPINVDVSQGRFTFSPVARLNPAPVELLVPRGPLLSEVHLSPEICARGLKFVAPILADTTVAEGRFSITMDGGRVPVFDPGAGDFSGHLAMRGQVKAGPLAQQLMLLVNEITTILKRGNLGKINDQSSALLSIDDNDVEFRMLDRRVYHRGLTFNVGVVPITTTGSVGYDESLSLLAEVPIKATFLGRDLSLGTLEGQTLKIPIEGTLSKPRLDRRVIEQFAASVIQATTRGLLFDEVNKQLDRFLPIPPQR